MTERGKTCGKGHRPGTATLRTMASIFVSHSLALRHWSAPKCVRSIRGAASENKIEKLKLSFWTEGKITLTDPFGQKFPVNNTNSFLQAHSVDCVSPLSITYRPTHTVADESILNLYMCITLPETVLCFGKLPFKERSSSEQIVYLLSRNWPSLDWEMESGL